MAVRPDDGPPLARLIPIEAVAALLTVGLATAKRMHAAGKLPCPVRLGGRVVRWDVVELHRWIDAGCPSRERWLAIRAATAPPSRN